MTAVSENANIEIEFINQLGEFEFTKKSDIRWRHGNNNFQSRKIEFISNGYSELEDVSEVDTPLSYFRKYYSDDFFTNTAFYTNLYAEQQSIRGYKHTTADELKKLFGLHILMGTLRFPRSRMYWNSHIGLDLVLKAMSYARFSQLRNVLHFVDVLNSSASTSVDKFYKLNPIINSFRNRCLQHEVEENISIDEQIVPFKGKLAIKQYIKGKPCPWGIKIYMLCGKSGLPYDFLIYQGKTTSLPEDNIKRFGYGASIVLYLCNRITSTGHCLFFDNYFSTYALFEILLQKQINAIGTARVNRFANPPFLGAKEIRKKSRGHCEEVKSRDEKVIMVRWYDNKFVHLTSNFIGTGTLQTVRRWDKTSKSFMSIDQPEIVALYNNNMGGVDLIDQLMSYYRIFLKSKKWTLRVIFHFVDLAVVSSWVEYKKHCKLNNIHANKIMDLLNFRIFLARSLIEASTIPAVRRGRKSNEPELSQPIKRNRSEIRPIDELKYDLVNHMPMHDKKSEGTRCKAQNCKYKSHFYCDKCNVHLCLNRDRNCFSDFHRN